MRRKSVRLKRSPTAARVIWTWYLDCILHQRLFEKTSEVADYLSRPARSGWGKPFLLARRLPKSVLRHHLPGQVAW